MVAGTAVGWVDIGAIEVQVVCTITRVGSTRPIPTVGADIVKSAIDDVPGIREVVGSRADLVRTVSTVSDASGTSKVSVRAITRVWW